MASDPTALPTPARWFVASVLLSGATASGIVATLAARTWPMPLEWVLLGGVSVGAFIVQRRSFVLRWREHRVASTLDECVVLLGFLVVPPAHAVVALVAGILAAQLAARRAPVKAAYNVGSYALAASASLAVYLGLGALAAPPAAALAAASLAYALTSNVLISHLFARLEGVAWSRVFRERFAFATVASATLGASLVLCGWALWELDRLALLALVPLVALALVFADAVARLDREARVRSRLAAASRALLTTPDEGALAERILRECGELFVAGRAELTLARPLEQARTWSADFEGGAAAGRAPLEAPLVARDGEPIGLLRVFPPHRTLATKDASHDVALLGLFAGEAAAALETASVMRRFASLHTMHDRIVRHAPAGIVRLDAGGRLEEANEAFERAVGDPRAAWATLVADPELGEAIARLSRGLAFQDVEVRFDGLVFDVAGVPLPPAEGEMRAGAVVMFRDASARHEAAEAQRKHSVTRPLVRRIVLEIVREGAVPERLLVSLGRRLAQEVDASTADEYARAFREMGLGDLYTSEGPPGLVAFRADDLLERRAGAKQPTCHLTRGYAEGVVEALEGHPSLGSEVQCQSQGHHHCTFLVKAKPRLAMNVEKRYQPPLAPRGG